MKRLWLVALVLLIATACAPRELEIERVPGPEVGRPAPDFTWGDVGGETHSLSDYRGKAVILIFWSPGCSVCQKEMPFIEEFLAESNADEIVVLGISRHAGGDGEAAPSFANVIDGEGELFSLYWVRGVPTTFFIDTEGTIQARKIGFVLLPDLRLLVEGLLGAK